MKVNYNNSQKNTDKTSPDIRNNALFTDITAQEEVFVRGGRGETNWLSKIIMELGMTF
ncbi:hypothetical protein PCC9214_02904 [Planktothrix tepida]|uniref:Uncharacterized protein n=1 Tax=Planktothrix tepida PCC 9214 TaxID=671072 RepID=A0A1J1LNU8_9CYAN|nr:hypothetical protein [Planktothrix tepida]CAD5956574.1 hypothetical protein PCC9214_02904 [Planktothrix tepida]CUR34095.1 hypothetical protein PL9214640102 [Planktothrix tepida PCC 9214]